MLKISAGAVGAKLTRVVRTCCAITFRRAHERARFGCSQTTLTRDGDSRDGRRHAREKAFLEYRPRGEAVKLEVGLLRCRASSWSPGSEPTSPSASASPC